LVRQLTPLATQELEKLKQLKKEEKQLRNEEYDGTIHEWDHQYYANQVREKEFGINDEEVRNYFPLDGELTHALASIAQTHAGGFSRSV
jgi:Zn-dependent oligopeptidase